MTKTLSTTTSKTHEAHIALANTVETNTVAPPASERNPLAAPRFFPLVTRTKGVGAVASMLGVAKPRGLEDVEGFSLAFPGYPSPGFLMASSSLIQQVFMTGSVPTTPAGWLKAFNDATGFKREMKPVMFCHSLLGGLLLLGDEEMCIHPDFAKVLCAMSDGIAAANRTAAEQAPLDSPASTTKRAKSRGTSSAGSRNKLANPANHA